MLNRVRAFLEPVEDEEPPYGDFVVVSGPFGSLCVTRDVARDIERMLDRRWRPRGWCFATVSARASACARTRFGWWWNRPPLSGLVTVGWTGRVGRRKRPIAARGRMTENRCALVATA